jgi:hypothetical protein
MCGLLNDIVHKATLIPKIKKENNKKIANVENN